MKKKIIIILCIIIVLAILFFWLRNYSCSIIIGGCNPCSSYGPDYKSTSYEENGTKYYACCPNGDINATGCVVVKQ